MYQLVTQFGGYNLYAQIALGLFFFAFMLILISTLTRPRSQMQHYAKMALRDDLPRDEPTDTDDQVDQDKPANDEHGGESHE